MTDISITATSVVAGSNATRASGTAGETIAAGKAVYLDPTSHKWMLADSNSATAAARQAGGIALHAASLNQPIAVQTGGICPVADIGSGEYVCLIGLAKSTTVLAIGIEYPGVSL